MLSLFIYFILKWHEIQDVFTDIGILFEDNVTDYDAESSVKCSPFKIDFDNVNLKCFSKDKSSQTKTVLLFNKSCQTFASNQKKIDSVFMKKLRNSSSQTDTSSLSDSINQTSTPDFNDPSPITENANDKINVIVVTSPLANSTAILTDKDLMETSLNQDEITFLTAPDVSTKYYSIANASDSVISEEKFEGVNSLGDFAPRGKETDLLDKTPISFFSALDAGNEWSNIIGETSRTIKKVEEYIYDDYDTFAKEEFNQLFEESKFSTDYPFYLNTFFLPHNVIHDIFHVKLI